MTSTGGLAGNADLALLKRIYGSHARYYDLLFGPPLSDGRKLAAEIANGLPGRRLLDLGVGTGLSLPQYRGGLEVVGVDISTAMLARARKRIAAAGAARHTSLVEANAEQLPFAEGAFDIVVAAHIVSVTPDPVRMLAEMRRVAAADGHLIVVNHLPRSRAATRRLRALSAGWARRFGWRPLLAEEPFRDTANVRLVLRRRVGWAGVSTLLVYALGAADETAKAVA